MKKIIEVLEFIGPGFQPLVDYQDWRVAILNYCDSDTEELVFMQKHNETDEVFILLAGQCTLLVAEGADAPRNPQLFLLRPGKVYNVKKGVWHQHVLAPGTSVLVVENRNTTPKNSPKYFFGGG